MRKNQTLSRVAGACLAVALAGCGSSGSGSGPSNAPVAPLALRSSAGVPIAGMYAGTMVDSTLGRGTIVVQLTQSGTSTGGSIQQKFGSVNVNSVLTMSVNGTNATGTAVLLLSKPCALQVNARFHPTKHFLAGRYKSTWGCSGESGTFTATQKCYYVVGGAANAIERPHPVGGNVC
jgi:hypothetical protein